MASLNLSTNGPSIKSSYAGVINSPPPSGPAASSPTYGQWALFSVSAPLVTAFQQDSGGKESILKVQSTGEGELGDLIEEFSEGRIQFAFVKVKDPNTTLPKYVLIGWCGEGVPERTKGYFTSHLNAVSKTLHGYHVQVTARSDRDLTPEGIVQKVADASGSKYSSSSTPSSTSGPPPPVASKPAFTPTRSGAGSSFNPLASSKTRQSAQSSGDVDADGWGTDAPEVTRSQLQKVESAYKPIKVNMAELRSQGTAPSQFQNKNGSLGNDSPDLVKGGYQPVGKVDIAAIRAQAQKKNDDRPTTVKGAYEPVGKVDIAAIRAKAQKPADDVPLQRSQQDNVAEDAPPKSLADRSAAFTQSERLTTLPKPKVANRFGSSASNFTGTKAPTPGVFGLQSAPSTAAPAPVGAASRTFADEGGKTPAQIWAEKKARQRGESGAADTARPQPAPIASQTSGGGEWKSGYAGKSWAPVAINATGRSGAGSIGQQRTGEEPEEYGEEDTPSSPAGGVGAIRDRFKGAAPMGAPTIGRDTTGEDAPPINQSTRPHIGVPMPGLPTRPRPEDNDEASRPHIPSPPPVQRSPTPEEPERDESPVRIAMPVARGRDTELEAPDERHAPPSMPVRSMEQNIPDEEELTEEPTGHDPARGAGTAMAQANFEEPEPVHQASEGGHSAIVEFDYERAEDNELELTEGDRITNIQMVDDDWWMGTNSKGESGLFPSNYVKLEEGGEEHEEHEEQLAPVSHAAVPPAPAQASSGPTATAQFDYEAAEDNELSFEEGAKITDLEFPDEDWWFGHYEGKSGLFPSNYVELDA